MKAVVYQNYGPPGVLQLAEIQKPVPREHELLVKVHATTVTSGDVRLRASDFPLLFWLPARLIFGLFKPKKTILGHEFSGVVEATGKRVTKFKVDDAVFGTTTMLKTGSYAEFVCVPEMWKQGVVAKKPVNLTFKEAAALPIGGMTALYLFKKAQLRKGQRVLVYGASGSVGSYAVQIANILGATVTGVCSTPNLQMVQALGAQRVLDYTKKDYASLNDTFDIVFDAVGKTTKAKAKNVLNQNGAFISIKMLTHEKKEHLNQLRTWAEDGVLEPFIDRQYALEEIVDAHAYVDQGRKRGNVVVEIIR